MVKSGEVTFTCYLYFKKFPFGPLILIKEKIEQEKVSYEQLWLIYLFRN